MLKIWITRLTNEYGKRIRLSKELLNIPSIRLEAMIITFKNVATENFFQTGEHPALNQAQRAGARKLRILHATNDLNSLRVPSGNRLEKLKGDRDGQFSIAINMQWRICFRWDDGNAYDVEVVDYH